MLLIQLFISTIVVFRYRINQKKRKHRINLWLHNGHFDVIKSLKAFFASDNYCIECEKPYKRIEDHHCENSCHICHRSGCKREITKRCTDCFRLCQSSECFDEHKRKTGNQELSYCDRVSLLLIT